MIRLATILIVSAVTLGWAPNNLWAQFKSETAEKGVTLDHPFTQRLKVGAKIKAVGGTCVNIYLTVPTPIDWPEQRVKIVDEDISPSAHVTYRTVSGTVKQMVVEIASLPRGQEAHALVTLEIVKSTLVAPDKTDVFVIPKKLDRTLNPYIGVSPFIEVNHNKIKALAKEVTTDKETDWEKVEAIYDWVRTNIEYKAGDLKGAARALRDKNGDCEELSSLFIAMCRSLKIPARTVWVPGHCYSEFYLEDDDGKGHWFPVQSAGTRAFGGINEQRPILQKGDNFRDPDRPKEKLRYMNEFARGARLNGGGEPKVTFINEPAGN